MIMAMAACDEFDEWSGSLVGYWFGVRVGLPARCRPGAAQFIEGGNGVGGAIRTAAGSGALDPFGDGGSSGDSLGGALEIFGDREAGFGGLGLQAAVGLVGNIPDLDRFRHICMVSCTIA